MKNCLNWKTILFFCGSLIMHLSCYSQVVYPYSTNQAVFVQPSYTASQYTAYPYTPHDYLSTTLPPFTTNQAVFVQPPYTTAQPISLPYTSVENVVRYTYPRTAPLPATTSIPPYTTVMPSSSIQYDPYTLPNAATQYPFINGLPSYTYPTEPLSPTPYPNFTPNAYPPPPAPMRAARQFNVQSVPTQEAVQSQPQYPILSSQAVQEFRTSLTELLEIHGTVSFDLFALAAQPASKNAASPNLSRLINNANLMGRLFELTYGSDIGKRLANLLQGYITIEFNYLNAIKQNNSPLINQTLNQWFSQGQIIADLLSSINPSLPNQTARAIWQSHVNVQARLIYAYLQGNLELVDQLKNRSIAQLREMANYFTPRAMLR